MTTILSVSLPADLRATLDAEAKRQRRSRSYVVAEAVRRYVSQQEHDEFTAARDQTLRENLALTPADRVKLADDLWRELAGGTTIVRPWAKSFDTFDQYETWRRQGGGRAA